MIRISFVPDIPQLLLFQLATLWVIDHMINQIDVGQIRLNIYIDLSKAFDTLNHTTLLNKLQYCGIRGTSLNLFKSYWWNRRQLTEINGVQSGFQTVKVGVPQSSVLLVLRIYRTNLQRIKHSESEWSVSINDS